MDMLPVDRSCVERWRLGTDELVVLATGAQTGGTIFAVEMRMPPGGGPPVMHRHDPGEIFYVLSGEFTFYVGDRAGADPIGTVRRVTARAGDVVPLAGGTPHTIRNESASDAVVFVVHSPAGPMEGFARAAAALTEPTMDAVLAIAAANGVELLGPPPPTADVITTGAHRPRS